MQTVEEVFARLPERFRGLGGDVRTGSGDPPEVPSPLLLRFDISGAGGGTWDVEADDRRCRVGRAGAGSPFVTVRMSSADWLALWAGRVSIWTLMRQRRVTVCSRHEGFLDLLGLPYVGLLGPVVEAPRMTPWLSLHGLPLHRCGSFVSGSWPDHELFRFWSQNTVRLTLNARVVVPVLILVFVVARSWAGSVLGVGAAGAAAIALFLLCRRALVDRRAFGLGLITGLVTVRAKHWWWLEGWW